MTFTVINPNSAHFFCYQTKKMWYLNLQVVQIITEGIVLKSLFIYIQRNGNGGRKRGRETSMWQRYIDGLSLLIHAPARDKPATQACALTWNRTSDTSLLRRHPPNWATPVRALKVFLKGLTCEPHHSSLRICKLEGASYPRWHA